LAVKEMVHMRLRSAPAVAIVIDGWDLRTQKTLGIVVHRVTNEWTLRTEVIGLVRVTGRQTADNIAAAVTARVEEFLGSTCTISAAVSDNGANYVRAGEKIAGGEHWPCACHTIQLAIRDVTGEQAPASRAKTVIHLVHDIMIRVRGDSVLRAALAAEQQSQGLPDLAPVLDNDTRWHSELAMLERFVQIFQPLRAAVRGREYEPHSRDYTDAMDIVEVLSSVRQVSRMLEAENKVTLSLVLPLLHDLLSVGLASKTCDSDVISALKAALRASFRHRFQHLFEDVTLAALASAVDPRTGALPMLSLDIRNAVWKALADEALDLQSSIAQAPGVMPPSAAVIVCPLCLFAPCRIA
jgi:hypothetical protein